MHLYKNVVSASSKSSGGYNVDVVGDTKDVPASVRFDAFFSFDLLRFDGIITH